MVLYIRHFLLVLLTQVSVAQNNTEEKMEIHPIDGANGSVIWTCNGRHKHQDPWASNHVSNCAVGMLTDSLLIKNSKSASPSLTTNEFQRLRPYAKSTNPAVNGLNELLASLEFTFPDPGPSNNNGLTTWLTNIVCKDVSIMGIFASSTQLTPTQIRSALEVTSLDYTCTLDWHYSFGWIIRGSGWSEIRSTGSSLNVAIDFLSSRIKGPPVSAKVSACKPNVRVDYITNHGGVVASISNLFEDSMKDTFSSEVTSKLCEKLDDSMTSLNDMLTSNAEKLEPYLPCGGAVDSGCCVTCDVPVDKLSGEKVLEGVLPGHPTLIGGQPSLVNYSHGMVNSLLSSLDKYLNTATEQALPDGSTIRSLGINVIVRKLLNGTGTLHATTDRTIYSGAVDGQAKTDLRLSNVSVSGLDTFSSFSLLKPLSWWTLEQVLRVAFINVTLEFMTSVVVTSTGARFASPFTVEIQLADATLNAATLAAVEWASLLNLQIGPLIAKPLPCVSSTLFAANLTSLQVSVADTSDASVKGFIDVGATALLQNLTDIFLALYENSSLSALPNYAQSKRDIVNAFLPHILDFECPKAKSVEFPPDIVNFQTSHTFATIRDLMNHVITSTSVSNAISSATDGEVVVGEGIDLQIDHATSHTYVKVNNVRLSGIDDVDEIRLLEPLPAGRSPYVLRQIIGLGLTPARALTRGRRLHAAQGPIVFSVDVAFGQDFSNGSRILNNFTLSLDINQVQLLVDVLAMVDSARVAQLRVLDLLTPACYFTVFPPKRELDGASSLSFHNAAIMFHELRLGLTCHSCSSQSLNDMQQRLQTESAELAQQRLTSMTNWLAGDLVSALQAPEVQGVLDFLVGSAPEHCASGGGLINRSELQEAFSHVWGVSVPDTSESEAALVPTLLAIIGFSLLVVVLPFCFCGGSGKKSTESGDSSSEKEKDEEEKVVLTHALVCNPAVPRFVRILVLVLLATSIVFFIIAHLAISISVDIRIHILSVNLSVDGLSETSLMRGLHELVMAGSILLALAFYALSVAWAYVRLFATIALWCAPPSRVDPLRRGRLLHLLGSLSKYCIVDCYGLGMIMVALNVEFRSPSLTLLPDGLYDIELVAVPQFGVFINIVAQVLSQLVHHVVEYYHDKDLAHMKAKHLNDREAVSTSESGGDSATESAHIGVSESSESDADSSSASEKVKKTSKVAVRSYVFKKRFVAQVPIFVHVLIPVALLYGCAMVVLGALLPTITIEASGFFALFLDFSPTSSRTMPYTTITLIESMIKQRDESSDYWTYFAISSIIVIYFCCTLITPILQMVNAFVLWLVPLQTQMQRRLLNANEVLNAWQYIKVYLIAVVLTVFQLSSLVESFTESQCDKLVEVSYNLARMGIISEDDAASCLTMTARPGLGALMFLVAVITSNLYCYIICMLARQVVEERGVS